MRVEVHGLLQVLPGLFVLAESIGDHPGVKEHQGIASAKLEGFGGVLPRLLVVSGLVQGPGQNIRCVDAGTLLVG